MKSTPPPRASRLLLFTALFSTFVIVYASLQPFTGWTPTDRNPFAYLTEFSKRFTRSDFSLNALAYTPLGFALYALWPGQWRSRTRLLLTILFALALSIAVEALQNWLPTRVSSVYDTIANALGAIVGASVASLLLGQRWLVNFFSMLRNHFFVGGATGDFKILLLFVWLIAQVNPGIPLFGATFHPGMDGAFESVVIAVEVAQVAAALIGIGLFTDLAMRKRAYGGLALVLALSLAVALKTIVAEWVLTPIAWESWLRPGHALGIATGSVLLMLLFWLPRRVKSVLAGIALLSSVLIPFLLPDLATRAAPLSQFSWHYGQLLNLNGLTRSIVLIWPFVATAVLLLRFGDTSKRAKASEGANEEESAA